jgi:hypothetical protein
VHLAGEKVSAKLEVSPARWFRAVERARRIVVRDVLGDRGCLKKHAAIIEHQRWCVAQWVNPYGHKKPLLSKARWGISDIVPGA